MRTIIKLSIMLFLGVFSTLTLAGSVYNAQRPPRPMVRDMSGFYVGLGAGMSSVITHDSSYKDLDNSYNPISLVSTGNNLFPAAQVGYWGHAAPDTLWGLKAFYKYLDANSFYFTDTFVGQVKVPHEIALLLDFGVILRNVVPYFGIGVMWLPSVQDIYREGTDETRTRKSRVGAIAQLGFLYNLTSNWFFDAVYSCGFTARSTYSGYASDVPDYFVSRSNRVTTQEVMMSINRRF